MIAFGKKKQGLPERSEGNFTPLFSPKVIDDALLTPKGYVRGKGLPERNGGNRTDS